MPDNGLPEGYEWVQIGDVAAERIERSLNGAETPVFSVTKHRGFVPSLEFFDRQVFSRDTGNYKVVRGGDLAYATIHLDEGSIGLMDAAEEGLISPMYTVVAADRDRVDPRYLFALLKQPLMLREYHRIKEGTVHRRWAVSFKDLAKVRVLLPGPAQQAAILEVLDSIDAAIEKTEAVIAATERLRSALLGELLTRGVPGWHTEWKQVPGIGTIPACWAVVRLGDVVTVRSGQADPREQAYGDLLFVAPDDIGEGTGLLLRRRTVSEVGAISGKYEFDGEDVIYSKIRPYLRKVYLPYERGLCSADMYPIHPGPRVARGYLGYILLSPSFTEYSRTCSDRTGIPKINRPDLLRYHMALPPTAEQDKIANLLNASSNANIAGGRTLDAFKDVKGRVAAALLSGRLRVGGNDGRHN